MICGNLKKLKKALNIIKMQRKKGIKTKKTFGWTKQSLAKASAASKKRKTQAQFQIIRLPTKAGYRRNLSRITGSAYPKTPEIKRHK